VDNIKLSKSVTSGHVSFPIKGVKAQTKTGKPCFVFPKPVAVLCGFDRNWDSVAFDITLVESGILLTIRNRYEDQEFESKRESKAADCQIQQPAVNGSELLLSSSKSAPAINFAGQTTKFAENGSSCNTAALERGGE
jgi:hypothetical protein